MEWINLNRKPVAFTSPVAPGFIHIIPTISNDLQVNLSGIRQIELRCFQQHSRISSLHLATPGQDHWHRSILVHQVPVPLVFMGISPVLSSPLYGDRTHSNVHVPVPSMDAPTLGLSLSAPG